MKKKTEGTTPLRPCQKALLASREEIRGMRVYRCGKAVFVLSGADTVLLELVCEECIKKAPPGSG